MKKIVLLTTLFVATTVVAQKPTEIETLKQKVKVLEQKVKQNTLELDKDYWTYRGVKKKVQKKITDQQKVIDSLQALVDANQKGIQKTTALSTKIQQTTENANSKILELDSYLGQTRLFWVIGLLGTLLLGVLAYLFLGKRIKSSKTDVETQIKNTKQTLEEESVKLDSKLVEVLETQLKLQQEQNKIQPIVTTNNQKEDHSLALKVADEIVRMQKNISRMDEGIKGLKPLIKGIERIQANFAANGYEMVNLLNKDYEDRMNIDVINFLDDDDLEEGKKIITKVIKPQVNYNGILIQRAQVEVSQN